MTKRNWVFIRGMMSESFHWRDLLPMMQSRFPGDQVECADILGTGPTGQVLTPASIDENLHALRSQVSANQKILVGFSLGGMLALEWAYAHPKEVVAVVVINGSSNGSRFYERMRPSAFARIARAALIRSHQEKEAAFLKITTRLTVHQPGPRLREIIESGAKRNLEVPVHPANFFTQLRLATKIPLRDQPPPCPVYLLSSAFDGVVHPKCSHVISERWQVPHFTHPTAGHDLSLDDPNWVIDHLEKITIRKVERRTDPPARPIDQKKNRSIEL